MAEMAGLRDEIVERVERRPLFVMAEERNVPYFRLLFMTKLELLDAILEVEHVPPQDVMPSQDALERVREIAPRPTACTRRSRQTKRSSRGRPQPERPAVTRTERSAPAWDWSGWRLAGMCPTATPPPRCGRAVDEAVARARPLSPGSEASVTGRHRGGSERDAYDSRTR